MVPSGFKISLLYINQEMCLIIGFILGCVSFDAFISSFIDRRKFNESSSTTEFRQWNEMERG